MPAKGQPSPRKGVPLPQSWRDNISKGMTGLRVGPDHPQWRGGGGVKYGSGWKRAKRLAHQRAQGRCEVCKKAAARLALPLDVHHEIPARFFATPTAAHALNNLIVTCRPCHQRRERSSRADLPLFAVAAFPPLPPKRTPITATCQVCSIKFRPWRSGRKFCSLHCFGIHNMQSRPTGQSGIEVSCPACNGTFRVRPSRLKRGCVLTCSRKCRVVARQTAAAA